MPEITVPVPDERIAEFYQFFGRWLSGSLGEAPEIPMKDPQSSTDTPKIWMDRRQPWTGSDDEAGDAEFLWGKFTNRAKRVFELLMEEPSKKYTGTEIADAVGIPNGAHGLAGVLAWPGRYGYQVERYLPNSFQDGADGNDSCYWMEPEVAQLFSKAKAKLEG